MLTNFNYVAVKGSSCEFLRNSAESPVVLGSLKDWRDERNPTVPRWFASCFNHQDFTVGPSQFGGQDASGCSSSHNDIIVSLIWFFNEAIVAQVVIEPCS